MDKVQLLGSKFQICHALQKCSSQAEPSILCWQQIFQYLLAYLLYNLFYIMQ